MRSIFLTLFLLLTLQAKEVAIVNEIKGTVTAKESSETLTLSNGDTLKESMVIMTQNESSAKIIFKDNTEVILGANSLLNLKKYMFKPLEEEYGFELFLEKGSLALESGKISTLSPESFELSTPDGTVAIRGTKFFVKVQ